jgi:uncharacterized membrane protein
MLTILPTLLVACVLIWAAQQLLGAFGIGKKISTVVYVLFVLLVLFWLLGEFGMVARIPLR